MKYCLFCIDDNDLFLLRLCPFSFVQIDSMLLKFQVYLIFGRIGGK